MINLDRSPDRYNYIKPYIDGLKIPVHRISAVDGALLSKEEIKNIVDFATYSKLVSDNVRLGGVGCYLSHIKALQAFVDSNYEFALIFEDDVSFDPERLESVIQELLDNREFWDINTFQIARKGSPITLKTLSNSQKLSLYLSKFTGAGAYLINRKAAHKLLEKALPIKMPIDLYFSRVWEMDLKFTGIENPRIVNQTFGVSEIRKTAKIYTDDSMLSFTRIVYKSQTALMRYLYNFNLYINMKDL